MVKQGRAPIADFKRGEVICRRVAALPQPMTLSAAAFQDGNSRRKYLI